MKNLLILFFVLNLYSFELQKPKIYEKNKQNINTWYMSEKLDGIRAYWTGKKLMSKNNNEIFAPKWFTKDFPKFELDGELWTKRNDFENIQNIVLDKVPSQKWEEISYNIFEVPHQKGNFDKRLKVLEDYLKINPNKYIKIIPQIKCKNNTHLEKYLEELISKKAEGIILKNPHIDYFTGRSNQILKVKKFKDMEGEVIGINFNEKNLFKSLRLKLKNNITFNLGNGFSKQQRLNHPKIGDFVTFKYYDLTKYGKPKFASFLRIRKRE